jgi:hypothetical protein
MGGEGVDGRGQVCDSCSCHRGGSESQTATRVRVNYGAEQGISRGLDSLPLCAMVPG